MKKKTLLLQITLYLAFFLTFLPGSDLLSAGVHVDIMALQGPTGLTLVKMIKDRPELGENVTTDYALIKSPDQIVAKLVTEEAEIAALPTNLAAVIYNKGINIRLLAITNWGVNYVVGRDDSIQSWADLKGKTVAIAPKGATPDLLFRFLTETNGLNAVQDLDLRYFPSPVELAHLVIAGQTDLAILPEPWATHVTMQDPSAKILLDFQLEWKDRQNRDRSYPQSCLVVNGEFAGKHPEILAAFFKEAAASGAWVNQYPKFAALLGEEYLSIPAQAGELAIPRCNLNFIKATEVRKEIDYFFQVLYRFNPNSIGESIPDEKFYQ